jgi:ubiquitin carboxyl-terminal hydrolase 16/45
MRFFPDAMGEKEEKGARAAEADNKSPRKAPRLEPQDSARSDAAEADNKSPRKAPRLEPQDSARSDAAEADNNSPRKAPRLEPQDSSRSDAAEPGSPERTVSDGPSTALLMLGRSDMIGVAAGSDVSSEPCRHFFANEFDTELLLAKIESLKYGPGGPACECCVLESSGVGQVNPHRQELIMVCTQCDQCSCAGGANREDQPGGHARPHARKNEHWVALWLDKPRTGYCFFCNDSVHLHKSGGQSDGESSVNDGSISSEVENTAESRGGHAHASGSNNDEVSYVVRGIPNIANSCYMNALVQCLLVLDKLRTGMLGPNAPNGSIGVALKELFVETRASNGASEMLNPRNLLNSICALDPKYSGGKMHDSHELLCSLRKWLNEEELKRPPNTQDSTSGAAITTVVDSIFQGELSTTRTNICCQYETVRHDLFHELPLPLPSKKHPTKSIVTRQRTHRSRRKSPAVKQLFPAVEECNSEKVQIVADDGDSGISHTEMESVAIEKSPEPLEVGKFMFSCTKSKAPQKW